jgi:hypothetical protein
LVLLKRINFQWNFLLTSEFKTSSRCNNGFTNANQHLLLYITLISGSPKVIKYGREKVNHILKNYTYIRVLIN